MANMLIVEARTRANMSQRILEGINQVGQDNVIAVVLDESGKIARQGSLLNKSLAYIYYKD